LDGNVAVISSANWLEYFGPFAGRAFVAMQGVKDWLVDVNSAPQDLLRIVPGIGPVISGGILKTRAQKSITDWDDLRTRLRERSIYVNSRSKGWLVFSSSKDG
jgi:predicted DNA-binding helix-hairpin-helix protein